MVYFENEDNRYRLWLVVGVIYDLFCTTGLPNRQFRVSIKPDMNMSACDLSFYYATVFIPWDLRALYGILSDAVPLFGSPRKLNIVGCYILISCCILLFAIGVRHLSDAFAVGVFLKVFFAFSEAVLDALSIDLLRLRCSGCECGLTASTDLQSAKMTFRTIGSILSVATTGLLPCGCLRKR